MINAEDFVKQAKNANFTFYAGVPCSFLTPLINYVINDKSLTYVSAANEGDAVSIAAGATIGGLRSVAIMQNSGLGNAVSPLTSLTYTFKIPVLLICTHRGEPDLTDEPQHELMGKITHDLFETINVSVSSFPTNKNDIKAALQLAQTSMNKNRLPHAFIMKKGSVAPCELKNQIPMKKSSKQHHLEEPSKAKLLSRNVVLRRIVEITDVKNTAIRATTGYTGRELYSVSDRANHLYMVGSMGCASSLALGLALTRPDLKVLVIDGDGATLMRMGNLATVGAYRPPNLRHLVLDNEAHDSTGGQQTVSRATDFAKIATACGYDRVWRTDSAEHLEDFLGDETRKGCHFMHMKIQTGAISDLPRPAIKPDEVLRRFMKTIELIDASTETARKY